MTSGGNAQGGQGDEATDEATDEGQERGRHRRRAKLVTVAQLARERRWHRTTAWRFLCNLVGREKKGQPPYAFRARVDGREQLVTTRAALHRVAEEEAKAALAKMGSRIVDLEERADAAEQRADAATRENLEFRRKCLAWFKRHGDPI